MRMGRLSWLGPCSRGASTARCCTRARRSWGIRSKALLCVGVAYFLVGVLVPVAALSAQGQLSDFDAAGLRTATIAGALGAIGAACIIWSFRTGGIPLYVMPLVFGGAPIVNVLYSMMRSPAEDARRTRCCTSASCSRRSAPAWCCTSGRRRRRVPKHESRRRARRHEDTRMQQSHRITLREHL